MGPGEWFETIEGSEPLLSAGRVMPWAGLEIRDENNKRLGIDEVGEVAIKNEGQITEIYRDPELTKKRMIEGWILTGDVGKLDRNGFLYLVDRKDDMIISGGMNIWPAELEIVISALPGVREVAVVSAPDDRWGETPVAVIVLNESARLDAKDVIAACVERLGSYKKPSRVVIRTEPLPRTPVGKIQRKAVRQEFWQGQTGAIGAS
jgi:acyl-CoA synthetase (AMP-forming)/AMP-acid ligase II